MRPPALGYRLRAGIRAYGTSNVTTVKLQNQDSKLSARHSESQRDRWQDEYVHSLRIGEQQWELFSSLRIRRRGSRQAI